MEDRRARLIYRDTIQHALQYNTAEVRQIEFQRGILKMLVIISEQLEAMKDGRY